jgi:hypothetical protein
VAQGQRAEPGREGDLLSRSDRLVSEEDHSVGEKLLADGRDIAVVETSKVHPGNLCSDAPGQAPRAQLGGLGDSHGWSSLKYRNSDGLDRKSSLTFGGPAG